MERQCLARRAHVAAWELRAFAKKCVDPGGNRSLGSRAPRVANRVGSARPSRTRTHPPVSAKSPTEASRSASVVLSMVARVEGRLRVGVTVARNPSPDERFFRRRRESPATRSSSARSRYPRGHDRSHDEARGASALPIGAAVFAITSSRRR
jgi:hypothetical protein